MQDSTDAFIDDNMTAAGANVQLQSRPSFDCIPMRMTSDTSIKSDASSKGSRVKTGESFFSANCCLVFCAQN
jgi:hypothetical protein